MSTFPSPTELPPRSSGPVERAGSQLPVVLLAGDGIGPEVTTVARRVLDVASGGALAWREHLAGAAVFAAGDLSGLPAPTRAAIAECGVVLKGPLETPIGVGAKSANVTMRKLFGLYANLRPARVLPGITGPFTDRPLDLLVVRENVEDLYAGIEHLEADGVAQALKVMTREGCERIVRTAFELARAQGRRRVDVVTKANILKLTEGMLLDAFRRIAREYPELAAGELLVDNCAHQLVVRPETLDVLICSNLHGDIISDLTSGLVGGLGVAPSVNLGDGVAVFEPVHGSAPDIAGQDRANPTATLLAGAALLEHVGLVEAAGAVRDAVAATLAAGIQTGDLAGAAGVGCTAFGEAVLDRLVVPAFVPASLPEPTTYAAEVAATPSPAAARVDGGVDVFVEWDGPTSLLAARLAEAADRAGEVFSLGLLANLGTMVWPDGPTATAGVVCARFHGAVQGSAWAAAVAQLLAELADEVVWVHVERLSHFDGVRGWALAQGER